MHLLRADSISKTYQGRAVLDRVDLHLAAGERAALLGPSGSGKSTLLHILGGLDRPDSGEVFFLGNALRHMSRKELARLRRERLGTVFQFFHLLPVLSVVENIALPLRLQRWEEGRILDRVGDLVRRVGLAHRAGARPAELSGGEMQRVAVARALAGKPDLILADEPTGNLDQRSGHEVLDLFHELSVTEGAAVLMVTHSEIAARRFERVLWLEDGRLQDQVPMHGAMP